MRALLATFLVLCPAWALAQTPAAPGVPTTQEGPLRLDLTFVGEQRLNFIDPPPGDPPKSLLRLQFRLRGADLKRVVRHGNVIFGECIDDTGKVLIDTSKYDDEKRNFTKGVDVNEAIISQGGLPIVEQAEVTARGSKAIKSCRGEMKVQLAGTPEEVVVHRALASKDGAIESSRLAALGVRVRIIKGGEEGLPNDNTSFGVQFLEGGDKVQATEIYDDWLKAVPARPRQQNTADGKPFTVYRANAGQINADSQLVFKVFPEMRTETLKFELKDLPMP